jgi:hypothetical protein
MWPLGENLVSVTPEWEQILNLYRLDKPNLFCHMYKLGAYPVAVSAMKD